jgi:hypothetical protein
MRLVKMPCKEEIFLLNFAPKVGHPTHFFVMRAFDWKNWGIA